MWQADDRGVAQWRPFAQYLSGLPGETAPRPGQPAESPVVTGVLPTPLWLRDGHRLVADPGRPGIFTKAYTAALYGQASARLSGDLGSLTAGAPLRGAAQVTAPAWAWTDEEIGQYFLRFGEPIDAGWLFLSPAHVRAETAYQAAVARRSDPVDALDLVPANLAADQAEAARDAAAVSTRAAHHIRGQAGETTLVFSTDPVTGQPALGGRPVTPAELARILGVLIAQYPELNQQVLRFAGTVSPAYVQQVADITGRRIVAADSPVFFAAAGLLVGTMVATSIPPGRASRPCRPPAAGTCSPRTPRSRSRCPSAPAPSAPTTAARWQRLRERRVLEVGLDLTLTVHGEA